MIFMTILLGMGGSFFWPQKGSASPSRNFMRHLEVLTKAPHPMGSKRQEELSDYLKKELRTHGLKSAVQTFKAQVPNPILLKSKSAPAPLTKPVTGRNVWGWVSPGKKSSSCVVILGSHYDTKPHPKRFVGANDSGSSSAVLLELLFHLQKRRAELTCGVLGVFFDGEEAQLWGWQDGMLRHPAKQIDHLYGSRYFVSQLTTCGSTQCLPKSMGGGSIQWFLLLDMVGHKPLTLTLDQKADPQLNQWIREEVAAMNRSDVKVHSSLFDIEDDHRPFLAAGIKAANIIDFYHKDHWHKPSDTLDHVHPASLEAAFELTIRMLKKAQILP